LQNEILIERNKQAKINPIKEIEGLGNWTKQSNKKIIPRNPQLHYRKHKGAPESQARSMKVQKEPIRTFSGITCFIHTISKCGVGNVSIGSCRIESIHRNMSNYQRHLKI
jgi:hypothetical protein